MQGLVDVGLLFPWDAGRGRSLEPYIGVLQYLPEYAGDNRDFVMGKNAVVV